MVKKVKKVGGDFFTFYLCKKLVNAEVNVSDNRCGISWVERIINFTLGGLPIALVSFHSH